MIDGNGTDELYGRRISCWFKGKFSCWTLSSYFTGGDSAIKELGNQYFHMLWALTARSFLIVLIV